MKKSNIIAACIAATVNLLVCAPVFADSLNSSIVPAKADVVGHIDITALRSSKLARTFSVEIATFEKELANKLQNTKIPLQASDILSATGLTFWAAGADVEHGALIVSGIDNAKLARALSALPGHRQKNIRGASLHRVKVKGEEVFAGLSGNQLVIADDRKSIVETIKTVIGQSKSLAQSRKSTQLVNASGVFFMVAFDDAIAKKIRQQASSPIFDNVEIRRGTLTVGEQGDKLVARATAETSNEKGANQLHKLAAGAMSFFAVASDDKNVGKLLNAINIESNGNKVTLTFTMPIAQLAQFAKMAH